jgi:hypothetical protein
LHEFAVVPAFVAHTTPQAPQFEESLFRSSQPFSPLPSHWAPAPLHIGAQLPIEQELLDVTESVAQTCPQPPQWLELVWMFSQPLTRFPSHCAPLPLQVGTQSLFEQLVDDVALFVWHAMLQPPQWAAFVAMFVSHPLPSMLSQFP